MDRNSTAWHRRLSARLIRLKNLPYGNDLPGEIRQILDTIASPQVFGALDPMSRKHIRVALDRTMETITNRLAIFDDRFNHQAHAKNIFLTMYMTEFDPSGPNRFTDQENTSLDPLATLDDYASRFPEANLSSYTLVVRTFLQGLVNHPDIMLSDLRDKTYSGDQYLEYRFYNLAHPREGYIYSLQINLTHVGRDA